jgi:tetratricopeptide (TPR) repeat protein
MTQNAEVPVPEAAKLLYAQLCKQSKSPDEARKIVLHDSLGHVYEDYGNYEQAVKHYSWARDRASQLGDSQQIVNLQTTLGSLYAKAGRLQDARRELESAFLSVDRRSPNAFATMRALANVWRDSGKVDEAIHLYSEIFHLHELRTHGNEAFPIESVAGLLKDMGEAYHSKGQLSVATSYYQQALGKVNAAGPNLPTSGSTAVELGEIYISSGLANHESGNIQQAEEYYRKALHILRRSVRANHPCIVEALIFLAQLQRDTGATESALATLAKAESSLKGRENHAQFANFLALQADLLRIGHRLAEAESAALRALKIRESLGSEETPELAVLLNVLASIYQDQHKYQDAIKQNMRALLINMKTVGTNRPETAATYNNLGNIYQDAGEDTTAESYYRKSVEIRKAIHAHDIPDVAATYNNIGTILVQQGRYTEAKEFLTKAVDIARAAGMPSGSPARDVYEHNLEEVEHHLSGSIPAQLV